MMPRATIEAKIAKKRKNKEPSTGRFERAFLSLDQF